MEFTFVASRSSLVLYGVNCTARADLEKQVSRFDANNRTRFAAILFHERGEEGGGEGWPEGDPGNVKFFNGTPINFLPLDESLDRRARFRAV